MPYLASELWKKYLTLLKYISVQATAQMNGILDNNDISNKQFHAVPAVLLYQKASISGNVSFSLILCF